MEKQTTSVGDSWSHLKRGTALAVTTDKRKNRALHKLKLLGGPFVNCDGVDQYISDQSISDKVKKDMLYTEVQYAHDTTLSMPRDSKLFSLKEKWKNLPLNRYVTNLKVGGLQLVI